MSSPSVLAVFVVDVRVDRVGDGLVRAARIGIIAGLHYRPGA